jgi:hypothetical protein
MTVEWVKKDKEISLKFEEEEIIRKLTQENVIQFTTKAPGAKEKVTFKGIIEGDWLWLYPFIGPDTFNNHKIKIK